MEKYVIANATDVGKERQINEDSMTTFDSANGRVVVVCDGMGGQAAGDVASQLACTIIRDILENNTFATPEEAITRSVVAANQGILNRAAQNADLVGMGCTCVIIIIKDNQVTYGWVGDSRIYYHSNGHLRQISRDQSYVQTLVDSGQITAEEAESHPQKNEITNALGLEGMTPPQLGATPITPDNGAIFMLCSDGLSGMVALADMEATLNDASLPLQAKAKRLIDQANDGGGTDNITVQLVQFGVGAAVGKSAAGHAPAKKGNSLVMIIAAAVIVLGLAIAAWLIFGGDKKDKDEKEDKKENVDTRDKDRKSVDEDSKTVTPVPAASTSEKPSVKDDKKPEKPAPEATKKSDPAKKLEKQFGEQNAKNGLKGKLPQQKNDGKPTKNVVDQVTKKPKTGDNKPTTNPSKSGNTGTSDPSKKSESF